MEQQDLFNWVVTGAGALAGFLMHAMWQAVKDLQRSDKEITKKVSEIEVLVAGVYVRKDEMNVLSGAIFNRLDRFERSMDDKINRLEDHLSKKADK